MGDGREVRIRPPHPQHPDSHPLHPHPCPPLPPFEVTPTAGGPSPPQSLHCGTPLFLCDPSPPSNSADPSMDRPSWPGALSAGDGRRPSVRRFRGGAALHQGHLNQNQMIR